jgi:sialic acid synthase SpsE
MKTVEIGGKKIGEGERCFVIAEAGVNHNGDLSLAKRLVEAAAELSNSKTSKRRN